jgi:hypothetical protein
MFTVEIIERTRDQLKIYRATARVKPATLSAASGLPQSFTSYKVRIRFIYYHLKVLFELQLPL